MSKTSLTKSPNDSLQQQSTTYVSTRVGEHSSLDTTSFASQQRRLVGGTQIGGGSYKSYILDHLDRMHTDIEATTRKLELEQRRLYRLDKDLESAESEYAQKRQRYKMFQNAQDDAVQHKAAEVRQLERRLEKAIADLNQSASENEKLREHIDQLRKERKMIMNPVFKNLERGIAASRTAVNRIVVNINEEKFACEEATQKNKALNKMLERERRGFHKHTDKIKRDVSEEGNVQREQERGAQDRADASSARGKNKRSYMVADEEEAFSEASMHRRILKLSFLNTIQRRHIKQHEKNIDVFEQAFATIKSSTGISDIEEIVKIFIGLEQRNFSLLTYVNTINREIESFETRNSELESQLKNSKEEDRQSAERKKLALSEITSQIDRTKAATKEKDKMIEEAAVALEDCRPLIWKVVKFLKQEMPEIIQVAYEGDAPHMRAAPQDEHEEVLSHYLMYIEDCLNQFRVCLDRDTQMQRPLPQPKDKIQGNKRIGPPQQDLPSAQHIAGDDSDDDPETGLGDRPLDRGELRERAQQMIARRRRKPMQQARSEERRQEATEEADSGRVPGSAVTSKDSFGETGANGSGAPVVKQATSSGKSDLGKEAPLLEEDSDRKEMWWRTQNRDKKK